METYLVGGAVRDELLGREPSERDWVVVGAAPEALEQRGFKRVGKDFPVFLHPDTGEEYALARRERKAGPGYHGFAIDAGPEVTLTEDLGRRDLTMNAMARATDGRIIDPYGGQADLATGVIRHVSPAFVEDPLRVLRVARFAARFAPLGFAVAGETRQLMQEIAAGGELRWLAGERVWQETQRALGEAAPARYFDELAQCHALSEVLPELQGLFAGTGHRDGRRALELAGLEATSAAERFAALVHPLDREGALARLCQRLPVARAWAELAQLLADWHPAILATGNGDPDRIWSVLSGCDALRRWQRFEHMLTVAHYVARARGVDDTPARACLDTALAAARSVQGATLASEGWRGQALGIELQRRRRLAVAEALEKGPQG